MENAEMREIVRVAIETLNILWVSHHANRGDGAIEGLEKLDEYLKKLGDD